MEETAISNVLGILVISQIRHKFYEASYGDVIEFARNRHEFSSTLR